jgi:hypothetical protein
MAREQAAEGHVRRSTARISRHHRVSATMPANSIVMVIDRAGWAARIRTRWQDAVEAIVDTGRLLAEAKASLASDDFEAMVETDLNLGVRTVQMLMAIAKSRAITNPANHGSLPPSWRTLYELSKLPESVVNKAILAGAITPTMERRAVVRLLGPVVKNAVVVTKAIPGDAQVQGPPSPGLVESDYYAEIDVAAMVEQAVLDGHRRATKKGLKALRRALQTLSTEHGTVAEFAPLVYPIEVLIDYFSRKPTTKVSAQPAAPDADETRYRCPSCNETFIEDELVAVRECSRDSCGTTFAAAEGNNCPDCNSPFTRKQHELGCPSCCDESECEEEAVAAAGPEDSPCARA